MPDGPGCRACGGIQPTGGAASSQFPCRSAINAPNPKRTLSLSTARGSAPGNDLCQDGAVVLLRTLTGLTVLALCLAGCGSAADDSSSTAPQFITPSQTPEAAPSSAPAAAVPSASPTTSARPKTPSAKPKTQIRYVFPVRAGNVAFHPTHGKYPATDIFADCGEPAVATTSGVILEVSRTDEYVKGEPDGPRNGGLSVSLLGDDGVRYYGSHLRKVLPAIRAGLRVEAGREFGEVGHTGNANGVCHLHFGISPPCAKVGDWKVRRGVIWPAPYLSSWRAKGKKSPVAAAASWQRAHGCKA
jgi:peptidoglycan LD-endopeptidase LytH